MNKSKRDDSHGLTIPLIATTIAAVLCLWTAWCEFPGYTWNEARLAPAFALRLGVNPYPLIGEGPLFTWIYGPVGLLINLPAAFATSAIGALHLESLLNFIVLIFPLAVIFFSSEELKKRTLGMRWLALSVAVLLIPRSNLVVEAADTPSIAFGLLSCWLLARPSEPKARHLTLAALFSALSIWSKQIAAFLVVAQFAYLFLSDNRSAAVKYFVWVILFNLVALVIAVGAFGYANLWLNLVAIPGRLPWTDDFAGRLALRPWALTAQIVLPCIGLLLLRAKGLWPGQNAESGRFFQLIVFVFLAMLPVGAAGFFKIGGDINLFHSWDYLVPGAIVLWLASPKSISQERYQIVGIAVCVIALRFTDVAFFPRKPFVGHLESATRLMAEHPHRIWFPLNPIITYYGDGKLWHSEDGVHTRFLANYGLREQDFRRNLPPDLEGIAYPEIIVAPFSITLLSEFNRSIKAPYWTLHLPSSPAPDKTQK
ncbi:MAG: hypothetical protein ABI273_00450 [Lacunisphaera sp.]